MKKKCRRVRKILAKITGGIIPEEKVPTLMPCDDAGRYKATHISAFSHGNAGDLLLPVVLRELFRQTLGVGKWRSKNVRFPVRSFEISRWNKDDMVVIGGGGLFLCDTGRNNVSGWQWNCSIERMNEIETPFIAFAIGYNRFRGPEDFPPIFTEHVNAFVQKASFVGIRNHGSIEALKGYLHSDELKKKLVFQPCMTTLIAKIYPYFTDYNCKEDFIAFNCAFDRQTMRSKNDDYLKGIAYVAKQLSSKTKIVYFSHMESDKKVLPYFDSEGVKYEVVEMKDVKQMVTEYSRPRLVIGMRGHAQMIPFGCQTPIFSVVSHDKMQWFLDDINHPEWGVDVRDADFTKKLLDKASWLYQNFIEAHEEIKKQQNHLWNITMGNMAQIKSSLVGRKCPPQVYRWIGISNLSIYKLVA